MFTRRRSSSKTRKACAEGRIRRSGYFREYGTAVKREGYLVRRAGKTVRIYPKTKRVYVKSRCIRDRGAPGKGVKPGSRSIVEQPLRKGELTRFGYHTSYPKQVRRNALSKAASHYGPLSLYRKLNAVAKLSAKQAPGAADIFARDREWVRRTYPLLKSLNAGQH
jgi:hypothetical protein